MPAVENSIPASTLHAESPAAAPTSTATVFNGLGVSVNIGHGATLTADVAPLSTGSHSKGASSLELDGAVLSATSPPAPRVSPAASRISFDEGLKLTANKVTRASRGQMEAPSSQTPLEGWMTGAVTLQQLADLAKLGDKSAADLLAS